MSRTLEILNKHLGPDGAVFIDGRLLDRIAAEIDAEKLRIPGKYVIDEGEWPRDELGFNPAGYVQQMRESLPHWWQRLAYRIIGQQLDHSAHTVAVIAAGRVIQKVGGRPIDKPTMVERPELTPKQQAETVATAKADAIITNSDAAGLTAPIPSPAPETRIHRLEIPMAARSALLTPGNSIDAHRGVWFYPREQVPDARGIQPGDRVYFWCCGEMITAARATGIVFPVEYSKFCSGVNDRGFTWEAIPLDEANADGWWNLATDDESQGERYKGESGYPSPDDGRR